MTVVITIGMGILFFLLIMVSIALHEIGHLVPAKLFGVKVTQYMVGFGRTLWSVTRGGTEYGLKAIPLGGYVRLIGMYGPARPGRSGWLSRMADSARAAELDDIQPGDDGTLLYQKKSWQKLIIMICGPLVNLLLAFLIFASINMFHGQYRTQPVVAQISDCVVPQDRAERICLPDDPLTPARQAGLRSGDTIVSFNGTDIESWDQLAGLIRDNRGGAATIVVRRDGEDVHLPTVHTVVSRVRDSLDPSKMVDAGFLGAVPRLELQRSGPLQTVDDMWQMSKKSVVALASFPVKVWNVGSDLIAGRPRDVNGPISIVGASVVAGELAVAKDTPIGDRVATWFSLLGSVNLFVALLNLVPLVPLDGGHMAGSIYEWIKRSCARLFGRPDPGPVDTARMLPVTYIVGGFLLISGVLLILADILSPVRIF